MTVTWDYSDLAQAYVKRSDYAASAIDKLAMLDGVQPSSVVCDIGAGVGHLSRMLNDRGLTVDAVEPNAEMRRIGRQITTGRSGVHWFEGTGEQSGRPGGRYCLVTFGSSFNVVDRKKALAECRRILVRGGWFACLWNHRQLDDPIQAHIESLIKRRVPAYSYGLRREDQTSYLEQSGHFSQISQHAVEVQFPQPVEDVVEAWRSHATLQRQAGDAFEALVDEIDAYLHGLDSPSVRVPYVTRMWIARMKP